MIVSVDTTVRRRVLIHDGILRHDPPKPADGFPDILRGGASIPDVQLLETKNA